MIFLQCNKVGKVEFIHYMPFDEIHGLGQTEEELRQNGILVNSIPEPQNIQGKQGILYFEEGKGVYYKYEDMPKLEGNSELEKRVNALEQSNAELMNLIMMQGITPK
ncbi:hypothetical protein [Hathewaya massiliensis]|uniref:hypothetical protein n=1 Tax=Hathewaya massiliensis TaxID=1964382 RepID=UPI001158E453|nr:hypothetical protein [Hathewaya massiliensis]